MNSSIFNVDEPPCIFFVQPVTPSLAPATCAGIRRSKDVVEQIGVERSEAAAIAADIVIMVADAQSGWTEEDSRIFTALWGDGLGSSKCKVKGVALLVANKVDLQAGNDDNGTSTVASASHQTEPEASSSSTSSPGTSGTQPPRQISLPLVPKETFQHVVYTSARTRAGLDELERAILSLAGAPQLAEGGVSWAVNERQADALVRAHEALMRVSESIADKLPIDFWTIDLRSAVIALGEVSGDEVTEEVLDSIFSKFCIGK